MRNAFRIALAVAGLLASTAMAAPGSGCDNAAGAPGMRARLDTMKQQMERLEATTDRAEQHKLMVLHMKHVREGLLTLRKSDMPLDCRLEIVTAMLETLVLHEQLVHESETR